MANDPAPLPMHVNVWAAAAATAAAVTIASVAAVMTIPGWWILQIMFLACMAPFVLLAVFGFYLLFDVLAARLLELDGRATTWAEAAAGLLLVLVFWPLGIGLWIGTIVRLVAGRRARVQPVVP